MDEKLKVPVNEFEGEVTYGQGRKNDGKEYGGVDFHKDRLGFFY